MTVAVIPAAGAARRMGRPKPLLPFGDTTILGSLVAALRQAGVGRIVVVARRGDRPLRSWLDAAGLQAAVNPRPEEGMLTSVWRGLEALGGVEALAAAAETVLISPADLPAVRADSVRRLLEELERRRAGLAVPRFAGRRGHPLAVAPSLVPEIARLDPRVGLRQLLDRHAGDLLEVEVDDPGVTTDVDSPADYRRLLDGD